MTDSLLHTSTIGPSTVYGVHGAPGRSWWKCLASRRDLRSDCEAVEWASVPPGGVSGEHLHTRTEEMYFVLAGAGEVLINGRPQQVRPRSVVLTSIGTTHGLFNSGDSDLEWLVIETLTPATSAALRGTTPKYGDAPMSKAVVIDMSEHPSVDTSRIFTGPLRNVAITELPAETRTVFSATNIERSLFVLTGTGTAVSGSAIIALHPGVSVTLPLGSSVYIDAAEPVELFEAILIVGNGGQCR